MMITKYGSYSSAQVSSVKDYIRRQIFFLLLYVDPKTRDNFPEVNVQDAFANLQYKLDGLNSILFEPPELVMVMSLVESALNEYKRSDFEFQRYRKLILDAGAQVLKLKEGDCND